MLHSDNAYYIENMRVSGQVCRTNTASNTAFRGFGGPKGMITIENIIEEISQFLGKERFNYSSIETVIKKVKSLITVNKLTTIFCPCCLKKSEVLQIMTNV